MTLAHRKNRIRRTREDVAVDTVVLLMTMLVLIITIYPFWYVVVLSFNDGVDALRGGIYFWPRKFTLANYQQFLTDEKWTRAIFMSIAKTTVGTSLTVLFTCLIAYGLAAERLLFSRQTR